MIHATAIVHPQAKLDPTVEVGPYAVIDQDVQLGPSCIVGAHVYITGKTTIGARNRFYSGAVIGEAPQDLKYRGAATSVRIGDDNVFREHVTVHRANTPDEDTVIGSKNFLMASAHVAHNCQVGNNIIIANSGVLGGHVTVEDRAFISGNCSVHQFCRVGTLAMMQGNSALSKDLPPFTIVMHVNEMVGLNVVGLRRAGYSSPDRLEIRRVYHALFRSDQNLRAAVADAGKKYHSAPAQAFLDFVTKSQRGVCVDVSRMREDRPEADVD